jgi:two-component system, cell cycle response regulator DivK
MSLDTRGREAEFIVLVVDDDADARRIYSEYLRSKGWTVTTAADGRRGIDKANELKPDVVVLDLAMPKVDGWTVLKHLRESSWTDTIPIVVVSALTGARDEAFQFGCDAFLTKPCPPEVVWLQIRALFRLRGQQRHGLDWHDERV